MKMNGKKLIALASAAAMLSALPVYAEETEVGNVREQLNLTLAAENASYDITKANAVGVRTMLCGAVYEQLVTLNSASEPVPELCESYEVNDTATEFTFHLRQGVLFHDGTEMEASDVVASLNRWIDNYSAVSNLVGDARFEETDSYTVTLTTETPCITLLYLMAGGAQRAVITTKECTENLDESGNMTEIIGTGPYKFAEHVTDQYVTLEKFDDYVPYGDPDAECDGWAGYKHAYTDKIVYWIVTEEATRAAGLQTGEYDVANVGDASLSALRNNEDITVHSEEGGEVALVFNKKEGLCADINMRNAVNSIVDADELLVVSYSSNYSADSSYMESNQGLWYCESGADRYDTMDYDAAASYLEAAGYNGETLRILVASANNFDKIASILEMELEAQGIDCEIITYDWSTFTEVRNDSTAYDLYISSFSSVPVPSLRNYFGANYAGWTDDEQLNTLWEDYKNATSLDDAAAAWVTIQDYCWDYLPIVSLGHYISNDAMTASLEGVIYQNGAYYWNAYIPE